MQHCYVYYPPDDPTLYNTGAFLGLSLKSRKHQELKKKYDALQSELRNEQTAYEKQKQQHSETESQLNSLRQKLEEEEEKNNKVQVQVENLQIELKQKHDKTIHLQKLLQETEKQLRIASDGDRKTFFRLQMGAMRYFWIEYHIPQSLQWKKTTQVPSTEYEESANLDLKEYLANEFAHYNANTDDNSFSYEGEYIVFVNQDLFSKFSIEDSLQKLYVKSGNFYYVTVWSKIEDSHIERLIQETDTLIETIKKAPFFQMVLLKL